MNGKKAKLLRRNAKKINSNKPKSLYSGPESSDNVDKSHPVKVETIYLTMDCWRFYYKQMKNFFKKLNKIDRRKI